MMPKRATSDKPDAQKEYSIRVLREMLPPGSNLDLFRVVSRSRAGFTSFAAFICRDNRMFNITGLIAGATNTRRGEDGTISCCDPGLLVDNLSFNLHGEGKGCIPNLYPEIPTPERYRAGKSLLYHWI